MKLLKKNYVLWPLSILLLVSAGIVWYIIPETLCSNVAICRLVRSFDGGRYTASQLWQLLQDNEALEDVVGRLGWFGPVAFILLNALQIVIAPIPGYAVQAAAGVVYGPLWGGIWATFGVFVGSTLAMWLARKFGRPFVERFIKPKQLERWQKFTERTDLLLWSILIFAPIGDLPFFLAGLSRVEYSKIWLITLVIRIPTVFLITATSAGMVLLTWWQLVLVFAFLAILLVIFIQYQERFLQWLDRKIQRV